MASFLVFFEVSGPTAAVQSPTGGYPSAEAPYFDFELRFLVGTTTQVEIRVPQVVLYSILWSKDGQRQHDHSRYLWSS